MDQVAKAYKRLLERFVSWAQAEDNVRGAFVIGSQARADHPADEWSDLDVIVLANDPQPYIDTPDWLHTIGRPWITFIESTPDGTEFERRVLFKGGLDVDFVPSPVAHFRQMLEEGLPPDDADIVRRGVRILVDKDGLLEQLMAVELAPVRAEPPDKPAFLNLVSDFWYHTVWTAKHLRRGELWWAKLCCDTYLKHLLLQLLTWHAQALRGPEIDTWMRGRFLEEWADPRAVAAFPEIFAHYEAEDIWRALWATMTLFRWLAVETAEALGYAYIFSGDAHATALVEQLFSERG